MKYITLKIPNNRFTFFMELINSLGFIEVKETISEEASEVLSEEEKRIIDQRLAEAEKHGFKEGYTLTQVNQYLKDEYGV
ncbi:MAG: hypothetical protein AAF960_07050 [Bacteroidota bacterium]